MLFLNFFIENEIFSYEVLTIFPLDVPVARPQRLIEEHKSTQTCLYLF